MPEQRSTDGSLRATLEHQWRLLDHGVRVACTALVAMALLLFAVGTAGDLLGWWSEYGFLTNVLSSLTGACVGIPLAILVFSSISTRQQAAATRIESRRQGAIAVARLREAARPFAVEDPAANLGAPAVQTAQAVARLRTMIDALEAPSSTRVPDGAHAHLRTELERFADGLERVRTVMLAALPMSIADSGRLWANLSGAWEFLTDAIRPAFFKSDLPWIDAESEGHLQLLLHGRPCRVAYILELRDLWISEYLWACRRLVEDPGPLDLGELVGLPLHRIDDEKVWEEVLDLARDLEDLRTSVESAVRALTPAQDVEDRGLPEESGAASPSR